MLHQSQDSSDPTLPTLRVEMRVSVFLEDACLLPLYRVPPSVSKIVNLKIYVVPREWGRTHFEASSCADVGLSCFMSHFL